MILILFFPNPGFTGNVDTMERSVDFCCFSTMSARGFVAHNRQREVDLLGFNCTIQVLMGEAPGHSLAHGFPKVSTIAHAIFPRVPLRWGGVSVFGIFHGTELVGGYWTGEIVWNETRQWKDTPNFAILPQAMPLT
jgi:hypothetical protein